MVAWSHVHDHDYHEKTHNIRIELIQQHSHKTKEKYLTAVAIIQPSNALLECISWQHMEARFDPRETTIKTSSRKGFGIVGLT